MQNLVVERDEDGKNAIGYLKRRDGGRAPATGPRTPRSPPRSASPITSLTALE